MKRTHEENREKICMPCGQKIACGKTNNVKRFRISESCEKLIKIFILVMWDIFCSGLQFSGEYMRYLSFEAFWEEREYHSELLDYKTKD